MNEALFVECFFFEAAVIVTDTTLPGTDVTTETTATTIPTSVPSGDITGLSIRLDEVVVGSANLNVGVATDAKVSDLTVSVLQIDGTKVESLTFDGGVVANIGGGALNASLTTATGSVTVSGPIETSLLSRRVDAELSWRFDRVHGGLGTWLRGALPEVHARAAPEVLDGSALARLGVPASGSVTWSWTRIDWTGGLP